MVSITSDILKAKVCGLEQIGRATILLSIQRNDLRFSAGQFFALCAPGSAMNREYSICSGVNDDTLEFLIRIVDGGVVSPMFSALSIGDVVEIDGPYGEFYSAMDPSSTLRINCIGTGTGCAPFRSVIKTFSGINIRTIHGVRFNEDLYFRDEFKSAGEYVPCVSRDGSRFSEYKRVTEAVLDLKFDVNESFYLCGNRQMITDTIKILLARGVSADQIFTEVFF